VQEKHGGERELQVVIMRLGDEAVVKKREGDMLMARAKLLERRRCNKRLERLRHGIELVDTQLDAIKTSELDKEIMLTLKASTAAMRKAGINLGVQEVESVMSELDEQMREAHDITDALSNPLQGPTAIMTAEDADLDAELDLLEAVGSSAQTTTSTATGRQGQTLVNPPHSVSDAPNSMMANKGSVVDPWYPRATGPAAAVV
jgi:hypothetical protein